MVFPSLFARMDERMKLYVVCNLMYRYTDRSTLVGQHQQYPVAAPCTAKLNFTGIVVCAYSAALVGKREEAFVFK